MSTKNRIYASNGKTKYYNYTGAAEELGISRSAVIAAKPNGRIKVSRVALIHQNQIDRFKRERYRNTKNLQVDMSFAKDERELEILRLRHKGYSFEKIGNELFMTKQNVHHIYHKIYMRQERKKKDIIDIEDF